jgi:hypothetical protein
MPNVEELEGIAWLRAMAESSIFNVFDRRLGMRQAIPALRKFENKDWVRALNRVKDGVQKVLGEDPGLIGETEADNAVKAAALASLNATGTVLFWVGDGMPVFRLTESLTAALMLTDPGDAVLDDAHWPFETFVLELPPGFTLHADANQGTNTQAVLISRALFKHTDHPNGEQLASSTLVEDRDPARDYSGVMSSVLPITVPPKHSSLTPVHHFMFNFLVYVNQVRPPEVKTIMKPRVADQSMKKRLHPRRIDVGREITLSPQLVQAAQQRGKKQAAFKIKKSFVVRGHWRNQAHGPGLTLRTLKWIKPFWKGPKDGPAIVERKYKVQDE